MRAIILSGTMIAGILGSMGAASAQQYVVRAPGFHYPAYYRHASTAHEGFLRGWADLTRAVGVLRYNTSLAMINREVARSYNLDNREKYVQKYFSVKKINKEYRDSERKPSPTQEDYARWAKELAPQRLAAGQYEPALGRLSWPIVFEQGEFATEREAIDRLMAERTMEDSGVGSANEQAISQLIGPMKAKLKGQIRTLSPSQYVQAKNFLESLEYEVQLPLDVRGVAVK
jgi:hypothetical protein